MAIPRFGPAHPRLGRAGYRLAHRALRAWGQRVAFHTPASDCARERSESLCHKLRRGEPVYLLGLGAGGHDAGASLVEVTSHTGARLLSSHEEERFVGIRHYSGAPVESLAWIRRDLDRLGLFPKDLHACLASFDYVGLFARGVQSLLEELPASRALVHPDVYPDGLGPAWGGLRAADLVRETLSLRERLPVVGMPHHGNHAAFAWLTSPWAQEDASTLVLVIDGQGDDSSVSCYLGRRDGLQPLHSNRSFWDSLGHFYAFLSSRYSGLPIGRAEGSWMAAAAFGNQDRETNAFYAVVRGLLGVDHEGSPRVDRNLAGWHTAGARRPFSEEFTGLLERAASGPLPARIPEFSYGNTPPEHADLAAATQLVFEDSLAGLVDHWLRASCAGKLILTGGTALNCVANLKLIERLGRSETGHRVSLWIPPAPADEGTAAGAAMQFALSSGASPGPPLEHAFFCGDSASAGEIRDALRSAAEVEFEALGGRGPDATSRASSLLAGIVAEGGIVGLFRGRAEIGRRALGHRSILANPRTARMRDYLNRVVKERQPFRPLAPICTRREADRWFVLEQPADSSLYDWMAVAVRARPEARELLPGVVHVDGTARVQLVSEADPLLFGFLTRLGSLIGAEVAINTSLNVQSPMVQTPAQAARLLDRSAGLDAILFLSDLGEATLAWSARRSSHRRPRRWLAGWRDSEPDVSIRSRRRFG